MVTSSRGRVMRWLRRLACALSAAISCSAVAQPAKRILTAYQLATVRDLDGLAVSPDGRWVAFQVREADPRANRYDQAWHVASINGDVTRRLADAGEPIQMTLPGEGRSNGTIVTPQPVWSPDSQWIAYLRKENGRTQIWRSRRDGRRTEQLTHSDSDARALVHSRDGQRLMFETEPSQAQREAALATEGRAGFLFDMRFWPPYRQLPVRPTVLEAESRRIWVFDFVVRRERLAREAEQGEFRALIEAGERAPVSVEGAQASIETPAADGKVEGASPTVVARLPGEDMRIACTAAECASAVAIWWRTESELIFARRDGSDLVLYAWRPRETDPPRLVLRMPGQGVRKYSWDCEVSPLWLVCTFEIADAPRRLVAIDLETGAMKTLYDPNPDFGAFNLGAAPQRIDVRTESGADTHGYLVLPPRDRRPERLPLVIVTYRCYGFLRGGTGDEYPVYPFAAEGFAVLCLDLPAANRGPVDRKRFMQDALNAAVSQLDSMGIIDPNRIGLTGLSLGGEAVIYALFNMPKLATAIASGTEFGPASVFLWGRSWRKSLLNRGLGSPTGDLWRSTSITQNADHVRAPLLLNVPDRELISSLHAIYSLEQAGRSVETFVFPDEYHIKWQPAHRLAIYQRNIDWMNFWLRGVEDSAPAKAEQYKRWRAMRVKQCELFKGDDAPWYCKAEQEAAH